MFFFFPALKLDDGKVRINAFDARKDGDTTNIDIVHIVTTKDDGTELTTHMGIQGRSDHLADAMGRNNAETSGTAEAAA